MKQTNERLCALAQKGDAAALDSLIDNNKSFIGKVANDLFRSMNLAQAGLNLDTDDLKQAGNLGLWKAVPKFDAARGMKFLTYAAPAIRNAMMYISMSSRSPWYTGFLRRLMSFAALAASGVLTFVRSRVLNVVSMAFCAAMPEAKVSSKYCAMR